ncbi:MAG: UDP-N-acetylglucosamine 2-epimerase (hydrolyzing) [Phycisphaerales bacterium]|nr:UDP-N-acetylglucosamine 2-epimerase (hydrolyzing) [Phycisphaerales bacterium]
MTKTRRIAVVTGTRAEWGLLAPIVARLDATQNCTALIFAAGAHLLPPTMTVDELPRVNARIPMQQPGKTGRLADAVALGRGIEGFARAYAEEQPDWVVVLGDRIEAFAAAAAASVGGIAVAHIHGGDRAEGVADEAMRHAITKLSHLHLAATQQSAERIVRMGEDPKQVHVVGSPAAIGIDKVQALDDAMWGEFGEPSVVVLLHPTGRGEDAERATAEAVREAVKSERVLWMQPNHDPDREAIVGVIEEAERAGECVARAHVPHAVFRGLLKRLGESGGVLVGNSSAGLIEAALLHCPAVDIGDRQGGRERAGNVVHTPGETAAEIRRAIAEARTIDRAGITHPYGRGDADVRIGELLMGVEPNLRKRNAY